MIVVVVGRGTQPHNLIPRVFDVGVLTSRFLQNNNADMKMNDKFNFKSLFFLKNLIFKIFRHAEHAAGCLKKLVLLVHE